MFKGFLITIGLCFLMPLYAKHYEVHKNIDYVTRTEKDYDAVRHQLDIYAPDASINKGKALVFIHGGSWDTGKKEMYRYLGKAFAANGIVTFVVNYRLSPTVKYEGMAYDCARAVAWVKVHASKYGIDEQELFVAGHSAGGHLAALIASDSSYFHHVGISNPIKGCILNDAFGLNIYAYLAHGYDGDVSFRITFTNAPGVWKKGSPVCYVRPASIKYYIIYGGKTYPAIISDSKQFYELNSKEGNDIQMHSVKKKKHIAMVLLYFRKNNKELKKTIDFMMQ